MQNKTVVFPTSRAIRHELLHLQKSTTFLPNYITISEFIERVSLVEGYKTIDSDTRVLLLLEASDFKAFEALQIERNFFTFTQNSSYILTLFSEISGEKVELEALQTADTYGDYEEHIAILKALYERYEKLCREKKLLDQIFLPKWYHLHKEYIFTLGEITIIVEGYLRAFELEIIQKCSQLTQVNLILTTTIYNQKLQERLLSFGFELDKDQNYLLDFTNKKVLSCTKKNTNVNIEAYSVSEALLQVAFVKQKVFEYIQKGIVPQDIAIILPNESFAKILKLYDIEGNFNFAMGEPFFLKSSYTHISAICEYIENPTEQNGARLSRYRSDFFEIIAPLYYVNMEQIDFFTLMQEYIKSLHVSSHKKIFSEELYTFTKLEPIYRSFNLKATLHLFMQRLSQRTIDDVGGGKITVMGVLESRYISYKGVIIVDFNDENVPKKSQKDLFLNSDIRGLANLPTQSERENLQKHYYALLMSRAERVNICYVHSSSSLPSRFLTQLGIETKALVDEQSYAQILHQKKEPRVPLSEKEIICEYDFSKVSLSATALKTFLECKRRYYYRYIMHLAKHEIPQDFATEHKIGQDLHEVLKNVFLQNRYFDDATKLKNALFSELSRVSGASALEQYQLELWSKKLLPFVSNEIERFTTGVSVKECEISLTCKFAGMSVNGQIDRIDSTENGLYVLDYKSGKYPQYTLKTLEKATDFQLEFYYLLASTLGKVEGCGYYDLGSGVIIEENLLEAKLGRLEEIFQKLLSEKSFDFCKTEDESSCRFCEYTYLCGRY